MSPCSVITSHSGDHVWSETLHRSSTAHRCNIIRDFLWRHNVDITHTVTKTKLGEVTGLASACTCSLNTSASDTSGLWSWVQFSFIYIASSHNSRHLETVRTQSECSRWPRTEKDPHNILKLFSAFSSLGRLFILWLHIDPSWELWGLILFSVAFAFWAFHTGFSG